MNLFKKTPKPERTVHELKTWPAYYNKVITGKKKFEIRELDRPFKIGDDLLLREWNPISKQYGEYTGRRVRARITNILYSNKTPFLPSFLPNGNPYGILSIEFSYPPIDEGRLIQATGAIIGLFSVTVILIWFNIPNLELKQAMLIPYTSVSIITGVLAAGLYWWGKRLQKKICKKFWAVKDV